MSLRDELLTIYEQYQTLTPALLVEVTREEDSEWTELRRHLFEDFDDKKAAETGRLHRARKLIQKYKVVDNNRSPGEERTGDVRERVRLFSALPSTDDPTSYAYQPTEQIAADPLARAVLLQEAERAWKALKVRYGWLKEFVEMVQSDLEEP